MTVINDDYSGDGDADYDDSDDGDMLMGIVMIVEMILKTVGDGNDFAKAKMVAMTYSDGYDGGNDSNNGDDYGNLDSGVDKYGHGGDEYGDADDGCDDPVGDGNNDGDDEFNDGNDDFGFGNDCAVEFGYGDGAMKDNGNSYDGGNALW